MRKLTGAVLGLLLAIAASPASAARISVTEESFLDVRLLLQTWAQLKNNAAPNGKTVGSDFYIRRARFVFSGQVTSRITFFAESDIPNFGKGGNFTPSLYLQDAFISFKVVPEFFVDAGLIIVPFTHHSIQGAVSLNSLEYHSFLMRYPEASTKVWRDLGVQLRGLVFDERFQYRVGVFGGVRGKTNRTDVDGTRLPDLNANGVPRFTAQLRYNVFDPESDFFFSGIHFNKKKVLSFGIAADYQHKAVATGREVANYRALGVDAFLDWPVAEDMEAIFQANLVHYRQGELSPNSGTAFFVEGGFRWWKIEPVLGWDRFLSDTGAGDYQAFHFGLNGWIKEHAANVKADFALETDAAAQRVANLGAARTAKTFTLQAQFFF